MIYVRFNNVFSFTLLLRIWYIRIGPLPSHYRIEKQLQIFHVKKFYENVHFFTILWKNDICFKKRVVQAQRCDGIPGCCIIKMFLQNVGIKKFKSLPLFDIITWFSSRFCLSSWLIDIFAPKPFANVDCKRNFFNFPQTSSSFFFLGTQIPTNL